MNNLEQFNEKLQVLPHDIRAEIIVADLLSEGMSVEDLVFKNRTVFSRNFHFDIERTSIIEIETTKRKKLCFEMNRDGIYDQLPEDLFHQVSEMLKDTDKEETIQEIKNQRSLESQCRLFFQPFEQEFYRERIKLEWQERKFLFQTNDFLTGDVFERIWNFPEFLDDEQKTKLGLLLPILHRIIGNLDLLQYIIENITGDQIQISINSPAITNLEEDPQLGEMRLNIDSVLAGKMPALGRGFLISITVTDISLMGDYIADGRKRIVHEFLAQWLFPMDVDVELELDLPKELPFIIGEDDQPYISKLNYTTIL